MIKTAVALLCVTLCLVATTNADVAQRNAIIEKVNSANVGWVAGVVPRFNGDYEAMKAQLGALKTPPELQLPRREIVPDLSAIPTAFDARTTWPMCPSLMEIRDQSSCGSCWAFGAAEAATDRICISTGGTQQAHLSAEDLIGCCRTCGGGCNGGYLGPAWSWFTRTGVVTGGNYGDNSWCAAYSLPWCDHHTTGQYPPCPSSDYPTPACPTACDVNSTYTTPYKADKHIFKSSYSVGSTVAEIQTEIMTNGPVEGAFDVYADFESYTGGVYQHVTGDYLGGHAIKILGWGADSGKAYWLVANSWNSDWGENGFFRILRGTDECGIEDSIVAGLYQ